MISKVNAILKREIRSYFWSPLAYVLMAVILFSMGIIFSKFLGLYSEYNYRQSMTGGPGITLDRLANQFYQNLAFVICFVSPFITMRLFAEEKRQSTMELLLTAPVTSLGIVLGKFFSAMTLVTTVIALTGLYAMFLVLWGNPDVNVLLSTYLGLILMLCAFVSMGGLISAFTSSQAIAAMFTFLAVLLLWLCQAFGQNMSATTGFIEWGPLLIYLSPLSHFNNFTSGLIHVKDVVYFLSFTAVSLFATHQVVESHRWS